MNELSLKVLKVLGDDKFLVETSRVCTGVEKEMTPQIIEKNIEVLLRDRHWSVFDHALVSYTIHAPIFVARQWMRHQQYYMEQSLMYTSDVELFEDGAFSKGFSAIKGGQYWYDPIKEYEELLAHNVAKEDARRLLPMETMTTVQCTATLRTLLHMVGLRLDSHAQAETRELAGLLLENLDVLFPATVKAYLKWEYQSFSIDIDTIKELVEVLEAYGQEGYSDGVGRFVANAKRRVQVVGGITAFLRQRRDESDGNSSEDGGVKVDDSEKTEEDGGNTQKRETTCDASQLKFEFDEMDT